MSTEPAEAPAAALEVVGLTVTYGGITAVDDVSFSLEKGSILGLIGPNGAGKTTVFDAICGFVTPDRGRIFLDGEEITSLTPALRARSRLGRSFQDGRLFPSLTVAECLAVARERHIRLIGPVSAGLRLGGVGREERKVAEKTAELIELMGLQAFQDKFVSELSTGTRRIVDLAGVLAHDPSVLLLDEPSSGIAQKEAEALGPLLLRIKEATGCTMLLVEHDMPLVTGVSEEMIALETGRVIARGAPQEVVKDPRVVEAYLGTDERGIARSGSASRPKEKAPPGKTRAARASAKKKNPAKKKSSSKKSAKRKSSRRSAAPTSRKRSPRPKR
jgi:ABC-type branched-subunit amino acid transport system ATPase component